MVMKKEPKFGICIICAKNEELHYKSHIYPKFIYRNGIFGENNRNDSFILTTQGITERETTYDAPYEEYKYCKKCENYFGKLENYSAKILNDTILNSQPFKSQTEIALDTHSQHVTKYYQIDYNMFKKFVLSLLLRASKSQHKYFSTLKLYNKERKIKKIIFSDTPSKDYEYPMVINRLTSGSITPFILQPYVHRYSTEDMIFLYLRDYLIWIFMINKKSQIYYDFNQFLLKEDGTLPVPNVDDSFIRNFIEQTRLKVE